MKLTDRYEVSGDVVARKVGGETVLLDLNSGEYFGLDPVGGRIWQLLSDEAQSLDELCTVIEAEFEAPRDVIEADMMALAADMSERKLIVAQAA